MEDSERKRKGRLEIDIRNAEAEVKKEAKLNLEKDAKAFFVKKAEETGMEPEEVFEELFNKGFAVVEFDETVGKASLVINYEEGLSAIPEEETHSEAMLSEFRRLRNTFPPVTAGIEWHKDFTSGGGMNIQIDNPKDAHQQLMKEDIIELARNVSQDQYTVGLDKIIDITNDIALTEGCAAAEICYAKEVDFYEYVDSFEEVTIPVTGETVLVMVPKEPKWRKLGGITRLKILNSTATRLRPYRHPLSGEVLFWTLDEKTKNVDRTKNKYYDFATKKAVERNVIKFHPWEILWLSWNQRGTNLKGRSLIEAVYRVAIFVERIQKAVGIGFNRWANKKYFFVCGTEKRPWSKKHVDEFLKAMEKMIKNNWVGIPVPQGFKVEEMGGESSIFEGKNLLDYLTGMICAGMQYPREFLQMGKAAAGDKAWLAWTVRYGRSQQQIRRAIEHQLFQKHLWCLHGKTRRVKKKRRNIYIPKLQWRAEGRWHREKKMETLSNVLNVANPADPPLKLGIQKEMADLLGLGELDWKPTFEYFETQQKIKNLQAEHDLLLTKTRLEMDKDLAKEGKLKEDLKTRPVKQAENSNEVSQEELELRAKKRREGGVSRTSRDKATEKGKAKEQGGTRTPKRT